MQMQTPVESESPEPERQAEQLCTSCAAPNEPTADFCRKCGAPISWYSKIGPFESIFAQGFIWREAAQRPRRLIVVVGIWLIFLPQAFAGLFGIHAGGTFPILFGSGGFLISIAIILKTTWNYLSQKPNKADGDQTESESDAQAT